MNNKKKATAVALADTGYSRDRFDNGWADADGDC
jgi:hypothetical protein